jgi:hypothetical protein
MELTHEELKALVSERIDEVTLLDILGLTSEDIVEAFDDLIEDKRDKLLEQMDVPFEEGDEVWD